MSKTTFRCATCKNDYPVRVADLDGPVYCKRCGIHFHLERLDEYVLLGVLGEGAFGVVYRAYDLHNRREVALKQLKESAIPQHEFESWVQRAVLEARALAKIDHHPNVLPLYTSGHVAVGRKFFMVTPIIRGQTLDKIIPEGGFPDPARAAELAVVMLRALHHVHGFKVCHRDVKPSNIMIDAAGNLYLVDFGLASCRQLGTGGPSEKGTVLGTPAYMPVEQARGETNRVGPWSDQYGAGAVLFHMLTGALPYEGSNPYTVVSQVSNYDVPPKRPRDIRPDLDAELEGLVLKSLRKFPGERFASCAEFADCLQAWIDKAKKHPAPASQGIVPSASQPTVRRRWGGKRWLTVAAAVVALIGVALVTWKLVEHARRPAAPTFFDPTKKPTAP